MELTLLEWIRKYPILFNYYSIYPTMLGQDNLVGFSKEKTLSVCLLQAYY